MTAREAVEALLARYAADYRAGDAEGCAAAFLETGMVISPYGPPASGRAAIAAQHAEWLAAPEAAAKSMRVLQFAAEGDIAWCLAAFEEGDQGDAGTSLLTLERATDGWRIRVCSLNG